jgi:hypothetical protein
MLHAVCHDGVATKGHPGARQMKEKDTEREDGRGMDFVWPACSIRIGLFSLTWSALDLDPMAVSTRPEQCQ